MIYFVGHDGGYGHYLVAWEQQNGDETHLRARRVLLKELKPSFTLSDAYDDQEDVALAFGPAEDETLVVWTDARENIPHIFGPTVQTNDDLGSEFFVLPLFTFCKAKIDGDTMLYNTVQDAVDNASPCDLVKVSGYCAGVEELVIITKPQTSTKNSL